MDKRKAFLAYVRKSLGIKNSELAIKLGYSGTKFNSMTSQASNKSITDEELEHVEKITKYNYNDWLESEPKYADQMKVSDSFQEYGKGDMNLMAIILDLKGQMLTLKEEVYDLKREVNNLKK